MDDTTQVQIDFVCGATGSLTTLMATQINWRLQLFGSAGWGALRDQHTIELNRMDQEPTLVQHDVADTLAAELVAFAAFSRGRGPYPVRHAEALAGVAAMEAIALSAAQDGERISVEQV